MFHSIHLGNDVLMALERSSAGQPCWDLQASSPSPKRHSWSVCLESRRQWMRQAWAQRLEALIIPPLMDQAV